MFLVNPVVSAVNAFLAIYENLPVSIRGLCNLALILLLLGALFDLLWHIR